MGFKFWLKIAFMIGSFVLVIYGMKQLQSSNDARDPQKNESALALLLGGDSRPTNWCSPGTKKIDILSDSGEVQKTLESAVDLSSVCETLIGPVPAEVSEKGVFVRRLVATDAEGKVKTVLQVPNTPYFKIEDMPMTSSGLEKVLKRLGQP